MQHGFLLFLTVALAVYTAVNGYILWRGWPGTAWMGPGRRRVLLVLFLAAALSYPLGRFFARTLSFPGKDLLILVGAYYLAFMVYFFFALVLIDIWRLLRFLFRRIFRRKFPGEGLAAKPVFLTLAGLVTLTVLIGHLNALTPRVRNLELFIPKKAGPLRELTLVVASDIHLGRIIRNQRLEDIVALINRQNPDLVLLPGDLTDEDISFLSGQDTASILKKIRAPLGVYSVTGNHEYYSGKKAAVAFLERGQVQVLEDRAVFIAQSLYLVGRKDRTAERFGEERRPLKDLMATVPRGVPVILMDHQPFHLEEASQNSVDLQLSGHTHNGQLFPGNFIVGRIFETSWGYLRKGPTQVVVSCGVGTWGPPVRTCSIPEIVKIKLRFH
jgi:predicted MPP superfamily phosphohydrolase